MDAKRSPDYLNDLANAVADFRDSFVELLAMHVDTTDLGPRGLMPAAMPKDTVDHQEIERLKRRVGRSAGRAGEATALTNMYIAVAGIGRLDPIANWSFVFQPKPPLEPDNIIDSCESILGRLEALVARARAEAPATTGVEAMHPLVWTAAEKLWLDGYFREAVARSCEAVITQVKVRTQRNNIPETALWQETFSSSAPQEGKPRLRWPGDAEDQTVKAMNDGLRQFSPGVQLLIRNSVTHVTASLSSQQALERLSCLSLLARWVDGCVLLTAE